MFWSTKPDSSNSSQLWCTAFSGPSGAANGLLRLSLDGQLSTIFWCLEMGPGWAAAGPAAVASQNLTFLSPRILICFFSSLPLIVLQVWAKGETENSLARRQQALVTSVPSALRVFCFVFFSLSLSPCCTCAPSRLGNKCGNVREHMWVEHTFARCTCAHASVRSRSSEISLPPVPQQGRALRSAQALPHNNKHAVGQMFIWQRCSPCSMVIAGILAQPMQPFQPFHWVHQFLRDSRSILTVGVIHYKKCWLVLSKPT